MEKIKINKNLLLTGAGFTANIGTPLSREVWGQILNNEEVRKFNKITSLLKNDFDFENVYAQVMSSSNFDIEEKNALTKAVEDVYKNIDETVMNYVFSGWRNKGLDWSGVNGFLHSFNGVQESNRCLGIHFTLNQDIFLERSKSIFPYFIEPIKHKEYWDSYVGGRKELSNPVHLPSSSEVEEIEKKLTLESNQHSTSMIYIKLHGSYGWTSGNSNQRMIIGKNKPGEIEKEPLLNWYFKLFETALFREGVTLWVLGYSFRDEHINKILLKAINEYSLKLVIVSPEDPESLKNRLYGKSLDAQIWMESENSKIWGAIDGYYKYKLSEIFPEDQSLTVVAKEIRKRLGINL